MTYKIRLGLVIVSLLLMIVVIKILKKGRIPIKYSLIWILSSIIIFLVSLIPSLFEWISRLFGFVTMANMVCWNFYLCFTYDNNFFNSDDCRSKEKNYYVNPRNLTFKT